MLGVVDFDKSPGVPAMEEGKREDQDPARRVDDASNNKGMKRKRRELKTLTFELEQALRQPQSPLPIQRERRGEGSAGVRGERGDHRVS